KADTKMVRVGFVAQPNNAPGLNPGAPQILPVQPAIQPLPGRPGFIRPNYQMQLQVGQDGMFALTKHQKENFYLAPVNTNYIARENNPNFDNELKTAKQL